jgi:hypothetical protein
MPALFVGLAAFVLAGGLIAVAARAERRRKADGDAGGDAGVAWMGSDGGDDCGSDGGGCDGGGGGGD